MSCASIHRQHRPALYRVDPGFQTSGGHSRQSVSAHQYRPPVTGLMNFRCALSSRDPESGFYHKASDGFLAQDQTVNFLQFFPGQLGAKIAVAFSYDTLVRDGHLNLATTALVRITKIMLN